MTSPQATEYFARSQKYWKQGEEYWTKGEKEKATELAWGSVVEATKALALTHGKRLRTHRELRDFVRNVASIHGDPELYSLFNEGEAAHSNFYEGFMDERRVKEVRAALLKLLERMARLMPG